MSATPRQRQAPVHGADPWWGDAPVDESTELAAVAVPVAPGRRASKTTRTRRPRKARRGAGWVLLGLLLAPVQWLWARMRASALMRTIMFRAAVVTVILAVLAGSVGVILINNVVMGRTAELGELDDRRRELRRDNALLGAQAARLSVPPVIVRRATKDLGMERSPTMPRFVYLDRDHRRLTPGQRRRIVARNRAKLDRVAQQSGAAASTADTAKQKDGEQ